MNARWLLAVTVVTAIVGAAAVLASESGRGGPAGQSSRTQIDTRVISDPVKVCVANVEGLWRYTYGATCDASGAGERLPYTYHDLVVPADTRVDLVVTADHGQHVLRISELGLTVDATPGASQQRSFRTLSSGKTYQGLCLRGCGHDRASASANVIVVTTAGYGRWLTAQARAIARQGAQVNQLRTDLISQGVFARSVDTPHASGGSVSSVGG
jgi:heme/copper-type cytochrome/quinol oxidase subunit 2